MDRHEQVMSAVREHLEKKPDASVEELYELGLAIDSKIGALTKRQFHARYPLQVKRKRSLAERPPGERKRRRTRKARKAQAGPTRKRNTRANKREKVRAQLLSFATALAEAETRVEIVKVLATVDSYVDAIVSE